MTELGGNVGTSLLGQPTFEVPHALANTKKLKFGSVTFSFGVYVYTHYYGWFCMVKGKTSPRSVGGQEKLKLDLSKVPPPVVKLD